MELTENQTKKREVYKQVECILSQQKATESESKTDAHVFFSCIGDGKGQLGLQANISGSEQSLVAVFTQVFGDKSCPDHIRKALLTAAANLISSFGDKNSKILGMAIGLKVEEKFGRIVCDCPKCQSKRQHIN
jgi:hypothetical protein